MRITVKSLNDFIIDREQNIPIELLNEHVLNADFIPFKTSIYYDEMTFVVDTPKPLINIYGKYLFLTANNVIVDLESASKSEIMHMLELSNFHDSIRLKHLEKRLKS